ncbi:MAG: hypothetical protein HDR33_05715 [Treponema sp.]|nr:hypothetical protein [Treponema sp.]
MANPIEFSQKVLEAIDARAQWYEENVMPKILDNYRLMHTCVRNFYDLMIKKSLIKEDPYRLDQKISGIKSPENSQYAETDRAHIIGVRFAEYETMLDWICTYYKFSVDNLSITELKKLLDFNNAFSWKNLSANSDSPNTRGLAEMINEMRRNADALTNSAISDTVSKCQKATAELDVALKDLAEFQKEFYKGKIRKTVFMHPKFDEDKAFKSAGEEMNQIKKTFPVVFAKTLPFYTQLVEELIKEDQDANKEKLQDALLKKLAIPNTEKKKKTKEIDSKELLMSTAQSLCAFSTPLQTICAKLSENNQLLQTYANSGFAKFLHAFRKAFGISEKPVTYEITILEKATGTQRKERIEFNPFCADLQKRMNFYNAFALRTSPGYKRLLAADEKKVLEFLTKQISDMKNIAQILKGFDTYFKNSSPPEIRPKIKGLAMELTALNNSTINTSQYLAEYISYVEEQEQMKKLGITG